MHHTLADSLDDESIRKAGVGRASERDRSGSSCTCIANCTEGERALGSHPALDRGDQGTAQGQAVGETRA
jgi:hypothetical protein